ncbi:hypothetical protein [Geobacter sp. SVR]|uniref:hypothetical protein n=1 Tax=Geobacter sp. SVR TaxID=2495594 RepID=UPI00143EF4F9|nr:hypothetical protein [Geobacter sp. SVR]BCS54412.1 hypothetical protein GSVR_27200 [Geobacter sp. SVR]GCF87643.1 hypothetical protein GSbR_42430 [Geobacter sp. SVR]
MIHDNLHATHHQIVHLYMTSYTDHLAEMIRVHDAVSGYYKNELGKLFIIIHVVEDSPVVLNMLEDTILTIREVPGELKQDPIIAIMINEDKTSVETLEALAKLDTRSPRLQVVFSVTDSQPFHQYTNSLESLLRKAEQLFLQCRVRFNLVTPDRSLPSIKDYLNPILSSKSYLQAFFEKYPPIIDIPLFAQIENMDHFANEIIDFWECFPWVEETVPFMTNGLMRLFFITKEQNFLQHIIRRDVQRYSPGEARTSIACLRKVQKIDHSFRAGLQHRTTSAVDNHQFHYTKKSIALDHDWDFVFDSYECQSPIFI